MIKLSQIAAAAVLALSFGGAQAAYVIDNFNTPQPSQLSDKETDGLLIKATQIGSPDIIGGFRDLYISKEGRDGDDVAIGVNTHVFNGTDGGTWSYSEDANQSGFATARWDGSFSGTTELDTDVDGLGGVNLSAFGTGFKVDLLSADAGLPIMFSVWTDVMNDGIYSLSTLSRSVPGKGSYIFEFAAFMGPANFSKVGAIELKLNGGQSGDLDAQVDMVSVVPEPGTLALAGIALLGLGAIRRRKS